VASFLTRSKILQMVVSFLLSCNLDFSYNDFSGLVALEWFLDL
jgi:hypothetical protein